MDPRAALRAFFAEYDIKPATFAAELPYDKANFHRLLKNPDAKPSLGLATRIERRTGGRVPASAWIAA